MIEKATDIRYCTCEKPASKRDAVIALMNRNHLMVDDADAVIALCQYNHWDDPKTYGGTAECMRYAASHGKPVCHIRYRLNDLKELRIKEIVTHDFSGNERLIEKLKAFSA